jgi:WbqC-like protein family
MWKQRWDRPVDLNVALIMQISDLLGIRAEFVASSELDALGTKTDCLISIFDELGADEYISGPAAQSYIEVEKFKENGKTLYWYEFAHPVYPQLFG